MTELIKNDAGGYTRADDPGEPRIGKPRVSVSDTEAKILSALALDHTVLEVGTGLGVSTRALAKTAYGVVTHDIDPWVHEYVWPELAKEFSADRLSFAHVRQLTDYPSFVFIDADHSTAAVLDDLKWAEYMVTSNSHNVPGLIVAHDANYASVADALHETWGDDWVLIPTEHGIGVKTYNHPWS